MVFSGLEMTKAVGISKGPGLIATVAYARQLHAIVIMGCLSMELHYLFVE